MRGLYHLSLPWLSQDEETRGEDEGHHDQEEDEDDLEEQERRANERMMAETGGYAVVAWAHCARTPPLSHSFASAPVPVSDLGSP